MKERILEILEEVCGDSIVREEMDLDLFEAGLLDSLGMIELLIQLEEKVSVSIDPTEVDRDEISTVNKLISYIEARK